MKLPAHVAHIDDETALDHGYIVTLADGCTFKDEPDCGVRAFDTLAEAKQAIKASNILKAAAPKSTAAV
jgi:hypothetical protein